MVPHFVRTPIITQARHFTHLIRQLVLEAESLTQRRTIKLHRCCALAAAEALAFRG